MGLKISKEFDNGAIAPECYVNIGRIEFSPMSLIMVVFYYTKDARDNNKTPVETRMIPRESCESRTDAYNYLKTLPEFSGAVDAQ